MTKTCTTAVWLMVVAVLLYCIGTLPDAAHGAPPQPKPPEQTETAKLYVYPKLLPPQPGEVIIRDPRALPEGWQLQPLTGDPAKDAKDPRTWA